MKTPYLLVLVAVIWLTSCASEGNYINFTLKAQRIGNCADLSGRYNMEANTAGERYIFQYCLKEGFDEHTATVERKGDTIVLNFPEAPAGKPMALYQLIFDLDTYPKYNHIQLGNKVIDISVGN